VSETGLLHCQQPIVCDAKGSVMDAMKGIGMLLVGSAVIDFMGMFLGYDLTGVSWSPIVVGGIGTALLNAGGTSEPKE